MEEARQWMSWSDAELLDSRTLQAKFTLLALGGVSVPVLGTRAPAFTVP